MFKNEVEKIWASKKGNLFLFLLPQQVSWHLTCQEDLWFQVM